MTHALFRFLSLLCIKLTQQGSGTNGNITAVVYVADSFGASSRVTTPIYVTAPQISVADLQNKTADLLSSALGSGEVDVIFQVVGAGAGILNDKECADPSQCQSLRESFLSFIFNASASQVRQSTEREAKRLCKN